MSIRRREIAITAVPPGVASSSGVVVVSLLRILLIVVVSLSPSSPSPFSMGFGLVSRSTPSSSKKSSATSLSVSDSIIAPEISSDRKKNATKIIDRVFGAEDSGAWDERRDAARATTLLNDGNLDDDNHDDDDINNNNNNNADVDVRDHNAASILQNIPEHELVYGELGIDTLTTILDAIGVKKGDTFLDIGSGDGLLVVGAALLYPGYLTASRGIEIVPKLYKRSMEFRDRFFRILKENENKEEQFTGGGGGGGVLPEVSFDLGNIYEPSVTDNENNNDHLFSETTIAICFATTWSNNIPGKRLDRLSKSLGRKGCSELPVGAKVVIIDGVLNHQTDGYTYEGELKLHCPDTAPYSIARLYTRT